METALSTMDLLGIWIAGFLTLAIYSFLYKDNPAYKVAEHIFVGVSAGYTICITWHNILRQDVFQRLAEREWIVLIPVALGLLMYARFTKKYSWLSRLSMAFVVGAGAGIGVPNTIQALLIRHTQSTIGPFITAQSVSWNELCILFGVVSTLVYFFFSVEHKRFIGLVSWIGIIYLMIYFGASFGYTVMARVSLIIGRMRFLLLEWLPSFF